MISKSPEVLNSTGSSATNHRVFPDIVGVVTPLPSMLLFSKNGHVARHDWLFGGGEDSFFSSRGEEEFSIHWREFRPHPIIFRSHLSPFYSCAFTSL